MSSEHASAEGVHLDAKSGNRSPVSSGFFGVLPVCTAYSKCQTLKVIRLKEFVLRRFDPGYRSDTIEQITIVDGHRQAQIKEAVSSNIHREKKVNAGNSSLTTKTNKICSSASSLLVANVFYRHPDKHSELQNLKSNLLAQSRRAYRLYDTVQNAHRWCRHSSGQSQRLQWKVTK